MKGHEKLKRQIEVGQGGMRQMNRVGGEEGT